MALMKIKIYSITIFFWGVQGDMETGRQDICLELLELLVYLSPLLSKFVNNRNEESQRDKRTWRQHKQQDIECLRQQGESKDGT